MIRDRLDSLLLACLLLPCMAHQGWGIELRAYEAARHDRFTGYPVAPVWNDAAWFGSRGYSGIGWAPADESFQRQFALITPLHLVGATHFQPNLGSTIRFLNASGRTVDRTVAGLTPISNELDQASDLTVITLSSPLLTADQVAHFPYLNLADEADYLDTELVVFGWHAKAGRGRLAGFEDIAEPPLNRTRMMRFDYWNAPDSPGDPDDCYLEGGDSGSPSFAVVGGHPALVGIHSTIDEDASKRSGYDTFVPHYRARLNAVLAPAGYQMTPAFPPVVSWTTTQATTPTPWRQANPGSCRFELVNRSANEATNLAVVLRFPASAAPSSLAAAGWLITPAEPGAWSLRRATLAAGAAAAITAEWLDLGLGASLAAELTVVADGSARQRVDCVQPLAPSYNAWAVGLAENPPTADPDGDGLVNLQEYGFGGDPQVSSRVGPTGVALLPALRVAGNEATVEFPVRDDAALRGLTYGIEFSTTLEPEAWSATPLPGMVVTDAPYLPALAGWLRRTVTFDSGAAVGFCRVRIEWNEN